MKKALIAVGVLVTLLVGSYVVQAFPYAVPPDDSPTVASVRPVE